MSFRYFLLLVFFVLTGIVISDSGKSIGCNQNSKWVSSKIPKNSENKNVERLLQKRIIVISQAIDDSLANTVVSQLLYLDSQSPGKDIYLYINSPGGSVSSGMAIYDTMRSLRSDVVTIGTGLSVSMGGFLLAGGTKGKRFSFTHTRIMIHQPIGGGEGNATDIEAQAKEILYIKGKLNALLAKFTGQSVKRIETDTERDFWMSPQEAKAYGIIDKVIIKRPEFLQPDSY